MDTWDCLALWLPCGVRLPAGNQTVEPKLPQILDFFFFPPSPLTHWRHSPPPEKTPSQTHPGYFPCLFAHVRALPAVDSEPLPLTSLCQMKWPFDDYSRSVCHGAAVAAHARADVIPPAFVICSIGRGSRPRLALVMRLTRGRHGGRCCTQIYGDRLCPPPPPSDSEAEDWPVIKGTVRVSASD